MTIGRLGVSSCLSASFIKTPMDSVFVLTNALRLRWVKPVIQEQRKDLDIDPAMRPHMPEQEQVT